MQQALLLVELPPTCLFFLILPQTRLIFVYKMLGIQTSMKALAISSSNINCVSNGVIVISRCLGAKLKITYKIKAASVISSSLFYTLLSLLYHKECNRFINL